MVFSGWIILVFWQKTNRCRGGAYLEQADGTGWMAMYALNMMRIALELALHNKVYENMATKFFEHFYTLPMRIDNMGNVANGLRG